MKRFGSIGTAVGAALAALVLAQAAQAAGDAPTGAVGGKRSPAAGVLQLDILARAGSARLDTATVEVDGVPVSQGALCGATDPCDLGRITLPLDTTRFLDGVHHLVVAISDTAGNVGDAADEDFQIVNQQPAYSSTATLTVGSGVPAPAGGGSGSSGGVAGASAGSCTKPKLSMLLDQRPLRIRRGVPVLVAGKRYRFTGRLTCLIDGRRRSAPKRTRIDVRAIVHGKSVPKGRATVGSAGKIVFRLAAPSSRTLEFRFTGLDGKVTRVRIKVAAVHVKPKHKHKKG
jgi:hypothetical protein